MRGIFLDFGTVSDGDVDLEPLRTTLDDWSIRDLTPAGEIAAAIGDVEVVVSNKVILDSEAINNATALKLICVAATGYNNVDLAAAQERGIVVCNVRAYATTSVVEHVFLLILALNRRYMEHVEAVRQGRWQSAKRFSMLDFPFRELSGQTLGIIGYGELGRAVAGVARAFGLQVLVAERAGATVRPGRVSLETLYREADIITLHCPLTPETENLLDIDAFRKMRREAIVINTARGGIVNEADLVQALQTGEIAAAAVDVLTCEPPVNGNPLLEVQLPNLVVTPHVAWAGQHARQRLIDELAENIRAFRAGKPRNRVG